MKQSVDSRVAVGIITVVVLIVALFVWRTYTGSSAPVAPVTPHAANDGGSRGRVEEMRQGHMDH